MAGGSRRPHTKSRLGCRECKRRKIKCDATGPSCRNCQRRGTQCEYADLPRIIPMQRASQALQLQRRTSSSASSHPSPQLHFIEVQFNDLELMHHWTNAAYLTVGVFQTEQSVSVWKNDAPNLAQAHPFLMHSMLAFASAHKSYLIPSLASKYMNQARKHHGASMAGFRTIPEAVVRNLDFGAMIAFGILSISTALALMQEKEALNLESFIEWILLVRRTIQFSKSCELYICKSQLATTLIAAARNEPLRAVTMDEELSQSLNRLVALNFESCDSPNDKAVLLNAITISRQFYHFIDPNTLQTRVHIVNWTTLLPERYFELLRKKNPVAISLLAHVLVSMKNSPKKWFIGRCSELIIFDIFHELGEGGADAVGWPVKYIRESHGMDEA